MRIAAGGQRSLDDLGTPLSEVTFCVLDIETTGSDRGADLITEIGMVKVRGGEFLGTLQSLVNPGRAIPPMITVLTGITESMVVRAPPIEAVLPSMIEFLADAVVVGHNVGFDLAFINAALSRRGDPEIDNPVVDTLPLARRLIRDEVPDCRLGTLASRFRLDHRPSHRALDDALATTDLLHFLLERAAGLGVLGLDDLIALPRIGAHPQAAKLRLTVALPRSPGVYLFRGANDQVIYVGKATNLRQRVRSYFGSDDRRKIGQLLREAQRITYVTTPNVLAAEVLELRYLHQLAPRYNKVGTAPQKYRYVRLNIDEAWPRLSVVNEAKTGGVHVGPLPSKASADLVVEAIQSVFPLRRCTARLGRSFQPQPEAALCTPAQLGVAACPCAGAADAKHYEMVVERVVQSMTTSPELIIVPLQARLGTLSAERRYEEAAQVRDRAMAFTNAMRRQRLTDRLREAGDVGLLLGETTLHVRHGVLVGTAHDGQLEIGLSLATPEVPPAPQVLPRDVVDEVLCLARSIERLAHRLTVLWCDGHWQWPTDAVPEVVGRAPPQSEPQAA
ncbi:MAG TPA: DEDD exonuclease domain-containing protein [Ilumatobacteraceae bacterium]|nr:DEDD exonuclease domain-containing protein [Ilumatobacteraceae bacterium]